MTRFLLVPYLDSAGEVEFALTSRRRARRDSGRTGLLERFSREFKERPPAAEILPKILGDLVTASSADWGAFWFFEEEGEIGEAIVRGECPDDDPPVERVAGLVAVLTGETRTHVFWRRQEQVCT